MPLFGNLSKRRNELVCEAQKVKLHTEVRAQTKHGAVSLSLHNQFFKLESLVDILPDQLEADRDVEAVLAIITNAECTTPTHLEQPIRLLHNLSHLSLELDRVAKAR